MAAASRIVREEYRQRHQQLVEAARISPNIFVEYVLGWDHQDFHREWQNGMDRYDRLLILSPKDHGKCLMKGEKVICSDGSIHRVGTECPSEKTLESFNLSSGKFESQDVVEFPSGEKECLQVRLSSGRTLKVSMDHPFLAWDGWVEAGRLEIGQGVGVGYSMVGKEELDENLVWLLGLLIGDGCFSQPSRIGVSIYERELFEKAGEIAGDFQWRLRSSVQGSKDYFLVHNRAKRDSDSPVTFFREEFGIGNLRSNGKSVPDRIFRLGKKEIGAFLGGYFNADGTVNLERGGSLEYYSVSKELLEGTQELLRRLGITSKLAEKRGRYKGERHSSWRLVINGKEDIRNFAEQVEVVGSKRKKLEGIRTDGYYQKDIIPREWKKDLDRSDYWYRARGIRLDTPSSCWMTKAKALRAAQVSGNLALEKKLNWPVHWEKVVQIDLIGKYPVYGIEERRNENFLVGGVITHNTSQVSVARTIYDLGRNPNLRIKIITNSDGKSTDILTEISGNISENSRVQEVFPKLRIPSGAFDNKSKMTIERTRIMKDSSIEAIGIMTTGSGGRSDRLIADDVCDFRNAILEPKTREIVKQKWKGEFIGSLEPDGKVRAVCTPWSGKDLTAEQRKLKLYKVIEHRVGPNFEPLWPSKWGRTYLMMRFQELGAEEFDRQFRNKVVSEGARAVSAAAIKKLRHYELESMATDRVILGVDPGMMRDTSSRSSLFALGIKDTERGALKVPLEIREGDYTAPDLIQQIKEMYLIYLPDTIKVESNAFQLALAQWLEADPEINTKIEACFTSGRKKHDQVTGVKGMGLSMEREEWMLPLKGHPEGSCQCAKCQWVKQLEEFPYGERDDMVMSGWIAVSGELVGRPRIRTLG